MMRRTSESSQYHDETPRRKARRTPSHDSERLHSNVPENVPTSPYSERSFHYMGPHGAGTAPSPTRSTQPVSPHRNFPHHFQRSFSQPVGSTGELSPRSPFPHSVVSPSHYPSSSPMYVSPAPSPSAPPATPSCATPSSVTYTLSHGPGSVSPRGTALKTPDFYPGLADTSQLSPADPNFPIPYSSEPKFPDFPSPREQQFVYSGGGHSPGGTIHHLGYNTPHRTPTLQSPAAFPNQLSPGAATSRTQSVASPQGSMNPHAALNVSRTLGIPSRVGEKSTVLGGEFSEMTKLRQFIISYYNGELETLKANYREKLQELCFLQTGGNMMDFLLWKKRPNPAFQAFFNSNRLDDASGTNPTLSPMTASPRLFKWPQQQSESSNPTNYTSLQRQVYEQAGLDPRKAVPSNFSGNPSFKSQLSVTEGIAPNVSPFTGNQPIPRSNVGSSVPPYSRSLSLPNPPLEPHITQGHSSNHFGSDSTNVTPTPNHTPGVNIPHAGVSNPAIANGPTLLSHGAKSTLNTRSQSLTSVLEQHSFISQEDIAVEAKKEAEVLKRVSELRKEGLWALSRLPKVQEMTRCKAHWDYLLEEMQWLATDFLQERRWKRGICKKLSRAVLKYHQEQRSKEVKAEKEESVRLRKIAASIAKEIKQFWGSVEKVVQYKVQSRLEENRKKALDLQLNFIVDQTEKYSSWLAESLAVPPSSGHASGGSTGPSSPVSSKPETGGDSEFELTKEADDDEETIEIEEAHEESASRENELDLLRQESEIPLEKLLESLPPEMLEERSDEDGSEDGEDSSAEDESEGSSKESDDSDVEVDVEGDNDEEEEPKEKQDTTKIKNASGSGEVAEADEDFVMTEGGTEDDEQTLEEEEQLEEGDDHKSEIDNLQKEGIPYCQELMKVYISSPGLNRNTGV